MKRWITASLITILTLGILLAVPLGGTNAQPQPTLPDAQPETHRTATSTTTLTLTATPTRTATPTLTPTATATPTAEDCSLKQVLLSKITGNQIFPAPKANFMVGGTGPYGLDPPLPMVGPQSQSPFPRPVLTVENAKFVAPPFPKKGDTVSVQFDLTVTEKENLSTDKVLVGPLTMICSLPFMTTVENVGFALPRPPGPASSIVSLTLIVILDP